MNAELISMVRSIAKHGADWRINEVLNRAADALEAAEKRIEDERRTGMSEQKLKPCPFCGGEATPVYCENGNRYTSNILYLSKRGTVKCKRCEIVLPRVYSKVSKAIDAWNRRANDEQADC